MSELASVLTGVRVLDFGRYIAGPYCAALLADLGADVIRIERPGGGEDRWVAPVADDGVGAMYVVMNRNKRAMTLDPSCPEGREIVKKLVATADVVVANLPPEVLRSLSLDLESLRTVKPDIILTTVTAYGAGGPWSAKHGFDGIGQVMCGSSYLTGTPEQPLRAAVAWVDCGTVPPADGQGTEGRRCAPQDGDRLQQPDPGRAAGRAAEPDRDREPRSDLGAVGSVQDQGRLDSRPRDRRADVPPLGQADG